MRDKLILKVVITPASAHDSKAFEKLIDERDCVVHTDSAYSGATIKAALAARKVEEQGRPGIHSAKDKRQATVSSCTPVHELSMCLRR